jgi:hypothetical protein
MKREVLNINSSRFMTSKVYTWNSALREMVHVVKAGLLTDEQSAECVDKELWKEGKKHIKGVFTWKTDKGNIITITIEKE